MIEEAFRAERMAAGEAFASSEIELRARLYTLSRDEHVLLLGLHAMYADAKGVSNLFRELARAYADPAGLEAAEEIVQYADFSQVLNELLEGDETEAGRAYWRKKDFSNLPNLKLPFAQDHTQEHSFTPRQVVLPLTGELTEKLNDAARTAAVSEVLLACWQALLKRLTGQAEIILGVTCDGRTYEGQEESLGLFAKSVPLACRVEDETTFAELVERANEAVGELVRWQEYFSWAQLLELTVGNDAAPFFFPYGYEFETQAAEILAGEIVFTIEQQHACTERFELKLRSAERDGRLRLEFDYDAARFSATQIERLAAQFTTLLESALSAPSTKVAELELVSAAERQQLLREWNDTAADYPRQLCAHELFEQQVERTPAAVAVECGDEQVSYAELNERAERLAAHLRSYGVGADVLVGVLMERSVEMVVGLLGILKAGGAYVPVDVSYPADRVRYMLADAGVTVLLTHAVLADERRELSRDGRVKVLCVNAAGVATEPLHQAQREEIQDSNIDTQHDTEMPRVRPAADNLAYVIYTSGSTGRPKGVMVTHSGLVNYLHWAIQAYDVANGDGTLLHSPLGFDLTVTSIYTPLLTGRTLRILPEAAGLEGLSAALRQATNLSLLKLTPAHLGVLSQWMPESEAAGRARAFVIGGEALLGEQLQYWQAHAPATRLINEYGPTETVVGCCVYEVNAHERHAGGVPIGRPIANTQLYVLDERMRLCPAGVTGELYVGGAGVARGYLNRPELTAERYVPDAFGGECGARLYRTGDVVRYREDGVLEYVGRGDGQVKVRGYRIELGEVEAVLSGHEGVRQAVVEVRGEGSERRLVAYVVGAEGKTSEEGEDAEAGSERKRGVTAEELRAWMRERVPEWMVPAAVVVLREMPLTDNGKVDRKALPDGDGLRSQLSGVYVAPQNEVEAGIAALWQDALHLDKVGIHDNFFDLGGHSLLMLDIHTALREKFRADLSLLEMFQYPTVAALAEHLTRPEEPSQEDAFEKINERAEKQREAVNRQRRLNNRRRGFNELHGER